MNNKDIIVNLTRENQKLKKFLKEARSEAKDIVIKIYCIGGPLNDNVKKYNSSQMLDFQYIADSAKNITNSADALLEDFNE